MSISTEQAQQNIAAIISEYLGDLQRNGKNASASLLKGAADESLAVIEKALAPPDNKDESHA